MPAAQSVSPIPDVSSPVMEAKENVFGVLWRNYFRSIDNMFRTAQYGPLISAANDAAAATAGVPVNGLYRNGSVVMVRVV